MQALAALLMNANQIYVPCESAPPQPQVISAIRTSDEHYVDLLDQPLSHLLLCAWEPTSLSVWRWSAVPDSMARFAIPGTDLNRVIPKVGGTSWSNHL